MSTSLSEPARAVLLELVRAYNLHSGGRFTVSRSISRRGSVRISHPGCNLTVFPAILAELTNGRFVTVTPADLGFQVLEITLRGFDLAARMEQA